MSESLICISLTCYTYFSFSHECDHEWSHNCLPMNLHPRGTSVAHNDPCKAWYVVRCVPSTIVSTYLHRSHYLYLDNDVISVTLRVNND